MKRTSKRRTSRGKKRTSKRSSPLMRNYTPPGRGFVAEPRPGDTDEDGELTLRGKVRQEMIQKLASEWNQVHGRMEERSFRSDEDRDAEAEYLGDQAKEYAERKIEELQEDEDEEFSDEKTDRLEQKYIDEFYAGLKETKNVDAERLSVIEEMLGELGGRMMRPYEHWNEEEAYREYAERDRGDDDY